MKLQQECATCIIAQIKTVTKMLGLDEAKSEAAIGRLPTDAEWELAAAAGATTRHYWGEAIDGGYLWYRVNSDGRPHPVAGKRPNAWGLYDVEGNAWEWALSPPGKGDPMASRRGGSWISCENVDGGPGRKPGLSIALSLAVKVAINYHLRRDDIGFRCACDER